MSAAALLEVRDLTKTFGGLVALDNISLQVKAGSIAGLIGPNGAGKSTLFNVLTGNLVPNRGQVTFAGKAMNKVAPYARVRMGMVRTFQKIHPFVGMTVLESVMVGHTASRAGLWGAMLRSPRVAQEERDIRASAYDALRFVGLEDAADTPSDALPLGKQRHLQLACALSTRPKVLLLDEPASGLNTAETADLARKLVAIRDSGTTLLLVEHDMSLVMKICEHITVLCFGKKLADGTPAAVRSNPAVIKAYLGGETHHA